MVFALTIASFVCGVVSGELLQAKSRGQGSFRVFLLEACLLWLTVTILFFQASPLFFLASIALAMGMHNTTIKREKGLVVKTYISGTLVSLGQAVAHALLGERGQKITPPLWIWLSFIMGAIIGASVSQYLSPLVSVSVLAMVMTVLTVLTKYTQTYPQKL